MNLTRYEQEVVINLNTDKNTATLYSANLAWIRKMDKLVQVFSKVYILKRQTEISKTYELLKKRVRIGKPRELSLAQKENLERMQARK